MSHDADYLYALEMQNRLNAIDEEGDSDIEEVDFKKPSPNIVVSKKPLQIKRSNPRSNLDEEFLNRTQNLVHPQWETLDPTPDIKALFGQFDGKFFQSRLKCVTLEWSKRMYSCAGICYSRRNRFGMDITIRLSQPLLSLRPRKDLVETMLHEMIHAYCFVLNIREGNGGHGPNFKKIMGSINKVAGTNITVYHTFHDEVELYKQHWWRCNGMCQDRSPFFGYVKRTSNRAPGPNDQWWAQHMQSCGGTFMKIKEPEKKKTGKSAKGKENDKKVSASATGSTDLRDSKRRRISNDGDVVFVADENATTTSDNKNDWCIIDDDIMWQEKPNKVITLSSDEDDDDENVTKPKINKNMTLDQRQTMIKQEIMDESINLCDDDIELIDDEYDDNVDLTVAAELADTSIIDEFFGEDTMMEDFKRENDCMPSSSRHQFDDGYDIITCPICLEKMTRSQLAEHLNGCTGIAVKILPRKKVMNKLAATSKEVKPTKRSRPTKRSKKDMLRDAGYTEADLANIASSSSMEEDEEEAEFLNRSGIRRSNGNSSSTSRSTTAIQDLSSSPEDENTRLYRRRNIYKTTKQCPVCALEIEESRMNDHLDECLSK